jgi:oligoendopeptidase F
MSQWLSKIPGISPKEVKAILDQQAKASRTEQAFVLLRQIFFSDFEYEIYQNPEQDFSELWSKMHKEYWGVEVAPFYADWDTEHYLTAPVYVQNYAIGILMVEQLVDSMQKDFSGTCCQTALGKKLKETYFNPGIEFDYLTLMQHFTGNSLSASAALRLMD